jgi:uncharacterized protein
MSPTESLPALLSVLRPHSALAVAVSGGVDSMVLAYVAHRFASYPVEAVHAVSPAVPAAATERVRRHALRHGWKLRLIDAGEMADPDYLRNPVDRCFHCKKNLYGRMGAIAGVPMASGTNVDDLSDFRPGLEAARQHGVIHPYVEAGLRKADIYALAQAHELDDLAALPAQPCLSSRIETGIGVDEAALRFIEKVELGLAALLPGQTSVRCRITAAGVVLECESVPEGAARQELEQWAATLCAQAGRRFAGVRPYRRGAAFLRVQAV